MTWIKDIDTNLLFSTITAFISVVALIQSSIQIKLNNKQHLFDRRINNYLITKELVNLYDSTKQLLNETKECSLLNVDVAFCLLTNNVSLESISEIINNPKNDDIKKKFLTKMEYLEKIASESELIFSRKYGNRVSMFIHNYKETLIKMYEYQILLTNIEAIHKRNPNKDIGKLRKESNECLYRDKLLNQYNNLSNSYIMLKKYNVIDKLKKEIKLYYFLLN